VKTGHAFAQRSHLVIQCRIHKQQKPFVVKTADVFAQRSHSVIHCRMHTGQKPSVCEDW
jgi:hypothetical protein